MEEIKNILKEYRGLEVFNTENNTNDDLMLIYSKNNVEIRYCPNYEYIEILGLNTKEYNSLITQDSFGEVIR